MSNILKKFISCAFAALSVASLASPAYCGKGRNTKTREEKKPFKRVQLESVSHLGMSENIKIVNNALVDQRMYEDFLKNLRIVLAYDNSTYYFRADSNLIKIDEKLKDLENTYKRFIFESGSISIGRFKKILKSFGVKKNPDNWKKEIYPIVLGNTIIKNSFNFTLTNLSNGCQYIFYFKLGSNLNYKKISNYNFFQNVKSYNDVINVVLRLFPDNPLDIKFNPVNWLTISDSFVPSRAMEVGQDCFSNLLNLRIVDVFDDKLLIGVKSFALCENLEEVNFYGTIKGIEKSAFEGCSKLRELKFPDGLEFIGSDAFKNCSSLERIVIPSTVQIVHLNAFEGTPSDLKIIYGDKSYNLNGFINALFANHVFCMAE